MNHTLAVLRESHVKELLELQGLLSVPTILSLLPLIVLAHSALHYAVHTHLFTHLFVILYLQGQLSALQGEISAFHAAADAMENTTHASAKQHLNSAAILALEGALTSSRPFQTELAVARATAAKEDDALISAVVDSIPTHVPTTGAPTLPELRARFAVVRKEVRKAAFAPNQAPTMIGQLIGSTLAMVAPAPKGD